MPAPSSNSVVPGSRTKVADLVARSASQRPRVVSIERQLPLLIIGLLAPILGILSACVYSEVQRNLIRTGSERLQAGAREVATVFDLAIRGRQRWVQWSASRPDLVRWARQPDPATEGPARQILTNALRRGGTGVAELWSGDGRRLLRVTSPRATDAAAPAIESIEEPPPAKRGIQPIRFVGEEPYFEVVADVAEENAALTGVVLLVRQNFIGGQGAELLGRLIDPHARLLVGNPDGSAWTDFERRMPPPVPDPLEQPDAFVAADGELRLGAGVRLTESPWILWVESDATSALAPADELLALLVSVGCGLLLLGALGAWWISRRITTPLRDATRAAEAIAGGDFSRRLVAHRPDELGRLTEAFNVMAARVEETLAEQERLVTDRTADLRRAVEQLRDAQDDLVRQEKLALLGQLAGSVGHELRNPLGVMTNAIFYLEMVLSSSQPQVREYLGILRRQVSLSEKITNDLLDFTRHRPPSLAVVDLAAIVDEQLARLGPLSVQVQRQLPRLLVRADGVQIGQVIFNLLTNAVQAMEGQAGGCLTVSGSEVDGRVQLRVTDSGPGVSEHLRSRVFEPLFTTRARGIGLGLSVSRRLAEANGGALVLAPSPPGGGATFVLELPAAQLEVAGA